MTAENGTLMVARPVRNKNGPATEYNIEPKININHSKRLMPPKDVISTDLM